MTDPLTIHELMPRVMAAVGAVSKSRENKQQGFKFRGIEDVLAKVQPALTDVGAYIVPHKTKVLSDERYQAKGGAQMRNVQVRTTFRAYGPSGDWVKFQGLGEGSDAGDKATAKALSIAQKYALFQAFSIPTEDQAQVDPDASAHEREDWFAANGWRDQAQHDAFMEESKKRLRDLPDDYHAAGKAMWTRTKYRWPLSALDAANWEVYLSDLERKAKDGELPEERPERDSVGPDAPLLKPVADA